MWELDFLTGKMNWFAGSNALEEFGLNKDNYSVDDWKESIHPEDRERVLRYFDYITASRSRRFVDVYRVRKVGGTFAWMMDQATIIRDERGKAITGIGRMDGYYAGANPGTGIGKSASISKEFE